MSELFAKTLKNFVANQTKQRTDALNAEATKKANFETEKRRASNIAFERLREETVKDLETVGSASFPIDGYTASYNYHFSRWDDEGNRGGCQLTVGFMQIMLPDSYTGNIFNGCDSKNPLNGVDLKTGELLVKHFEDNGFVVKKDKTQCKVSLY